MNGYRHVAAVESRFQPDRVFRSEADARAFDRGFAIETLGATDFRNALREPRAEFVGLLRFMADEIESARWAKEGDETRAVPPADS